MLLSSSRLKMALYFMLTTFTMIILTLVKRKALRIPESCAIVRRKLTSNETCCTYSGKKKNNKLLRHLAEGRGYSFRHWGKIFKMWVETTTKQQKRKGSRQRETKREKEKARERERMAQIKPLAEFSYICDFLWNEPEASTASVSSVPPFCVLEELWGRVFFFLWWKSEIRRPVCWLVSAPPWVRAWRPMSR